LVVLCEFQFAGIAQQRHARDLSFRRLATTTAVNSADIHRLLVNIMWCSFVSNESKKLRWLISSRSQ
jgi:DNA-binding IclR family transcriptional regulator